MRRLGLPDGIRACLFDLDGVLTDTASVHEAAWSEVFADLGFGGEDYRRHVDGRRRSDGARAFLASRGLELPPDELEALVERKDALFLAAIRRDGVRRYEGSIAYLRAVADAGLRRAVVSASRHCAEVLRAAEIEELFELRVDGVTAARERLRGKPAPDTFLRAARALRVEPAACAVYEDALSGVAAGRAGGFGCVIGVARHNDEQALREHGADLVVGDLGDLLGLVAS